MFDGSVLDRKGFYYPDTRTVFINDQLSDRERFKVLCHELGHIGHDSNQYDRRREQYELQANRNMIHHLMMEELNSDDKEEFNYIRFMEKHKLKTIADEAMVIDEYYNLSNFI